MAVDATDLGDFLLPSQPTTCTLCALIPKLSDARRRHLENAMRTDKRTGVTSPRIWRVLGAWGYGIGLETVRNHRSGCVVGE